MARRRDAQAGQPEGAAAGPGVAAPGRGADCPAAVPTSGLPSAALGVLALLALGGAVLAWALAPQGQQPAPAADPTPVQPSRPADAEPDAPAAPAPRPDPEAAPAPTRAAEGRRKRRLPEGLRANYECALRCADLTDGDRAIIAATLKQAGCDPENPGAHVLCATTPEQVCVGSCGGGQQDMASFLPGAFGSSRADVSAQLKQVDTVHADYLRCAEQCTRDGVAVDVSLADAQARAVELLQRCGVVQLRGAYDLERLSRLQGSIDALFAKPSAYNALLDEEQLHDGRYQVYLPYTAPFKARESLGVSDLVLGVLAGYFGDRGFGIDHVSVLISSPGSGNQSLHPDVPYFKGLAVSVHTALVDITLDMGPTYFCPCTGEALRREDWTASAAVKMTTLKLKACFGASFAPELTPRGTVTIYDSAMFHKGTANRSGKNRPVLKLEVGAEGFVERRNYIQLAPSAGKKQVKRFRANMGPPRMGADPLPAGGEGAPTQ